MSLVEKYEYRKNNYLKTIACQRTDHVLAAPMIMYLPINLYQQCTIQEALDDYDKMIPSFVKYHETYQPDLAWGQQSFLPTKVLDILGASFARWPGKHFENPNLGFQILDHEYMSPDDYLEFAEDPSGFLMRKVAPKHYLNLAGLELLDFSNFMYRGGLYGTIPATLPQVKNAFETMQKAGEEMVKVVGKCNKFNEEMRSKGFPLAYDVAATSPFDVFNDSLRGLLNITMDMIEYPDELKIALEAETKIQVRKIKKQLSNKSKETVVFFIHNGMDDFMSPDQFEEFYWPGLKACINAVIESDCIPRIYLEGDYMQKLDLFVKEVPVGKCIFSFVTTDMKKMQIIKEKFAGKICIAGGVDGVLLKYGTKDDVIKNVKNAIDICAPGGGYIIDTSVNLDDAKPENLHTLFDISKNYMRY